MPGKRETSDIFREDITEEVTCRQNLKGQTGEFAIGGTACAKSEQFVREF